MCIENSIENILAPREYHRVGEGCMMSNLISQYRHFQEMILGISSPRE
jgi:hypothetical protein